MAKYMFIYRSSAEQHESDLSPDQMQKVMEAWNAWIGQGMEEKWMETPGDALKGEGRIVNHDKVVTDGPFAESKEIVGGFSIINAADLNVAAEIAKGCPAISAPGGTIEIRELAEMA